MTAITPQLEAALLDDPSRLAGLRGVSPADAHDRAHALLLIYDLHLSPLATLGAQVRWQNHPLVADLKWRLEQDWLRELGEPDAVTERGVVAELRALAARDRLPAAYDWLADEASWTEVLEFLALEGGPDGGFDDLVAICQVGLHGEPKLEMARNYWDEMGNGSLADVHTVLHDDLVRAISLPRLSRAEQPTSALERSALGGLLATNRWLQPEMVGALGLIELQAGPRSRLVLGALDRLDAPAAAQPFYEVHADVDPRHGQDWLSNVVVPLVAEAPEWGPRILRGALWRSQVNAAFFADVHRRLTGGRRAA